MLEAAVGCSGLSGTPILTDELTDYFESLEDKLNYKHWFFGHFHQDADLDGKHTVLYQSIVNLESYL